MNEMVQYSDSKFYIANINNAETIFKPKSMSIISSEKKTRGVCYLSFKCRENLCVAASDPTPTRLALISGNILQGKYLHRLSY